jgi:flagellar hook-associated protein 3 FlgL
MSMRISTLMLSRGVLDDVGAASHRLARTQQKLASGRELTRPSDDPSAVARAIKWRADMEGTQAHQRTVGEALGWAEVTDAALETINDALQRTRELTLQGANAPLDQAQRDALNLEVKGLIETVKQAGNASYGGRYVLAGHKTDQPPYSPANDVFNGTQDPIMREIGPGVTVQINLHGMEVVGDGTTGLLATLRSVEANLAAGNVNGLSANVGQLDGRLDALSAARAKIGATANRLEVADARLSEYEGTTLRLLSETEDADMAKAMIEFSVQQAAMQAGLKAGANIVQNSLLDFLR